VSCNVVVISEPQLRSSDWFVASIPSHAEVRRLVCAWHYSRSCGNTSTVRHGLYPRSTAPLTGEASGVAVWIPPTRRAAESVAGKDWGGVLMLTRFALHPEIPSNGASFLLGRSMRLIDRSRWPVLLTYADTALGHAGTIYKATNWECMGETMGGDRWVDSEGRQGQIKHGNATLSVAEMARRGFTRSPRLPKIKFVHRV
jgi:hypothetical protein